MIHIAAQQPKPIWTKKFNSLFLGNFFLFLTFYALLTTLPIYVLENLDESETEAGLVVTIFLLSAMIVRPFSGKLLETFGKKKMLMISMLFFMLVSFIYMLADQLYFLLALRFFHGIWFSIATTAAGAIAADIVPEERRGEGLGYFAMSMNTAVVAGPFIALTLLQSISFYWLFFILSVSMLGALFFTALIKVPKHTAPRVKQRLSLNDLFEKSSVPAAFIGCLIALAYSSIISFISIYAKSLGLLETASYFFLIFAIAMLVSRPFVGRLFDTRGPNIVIYPALVMFAAGLFTLSITDSSLMLLLSAALIGLGYGTLLPCFQTLAVQSADPHRSGHATATFFTFMDSGIAAGSYVLGIIVSLFGFQNLYFFTGVFVLMIIVLYKIVQTNRQEKPAKVTQSHSVS